ncbi:MAG: hypothetical protein AOA65_1350 [Candidatus Bathyarchaeota archaeon BA1]|nr:MAG: hypothetical protein AOA65_1350 [Candidatus Bathyarchaeota archaeon BA1]
MKIVKEVKVRPVKEVDTGESWICPLRDKRYRLIRTEIKGKPLKHNIEESE